MRKLIRRIEIKEDETIIFTMNGVPVTVGIPRVHTWQDEGREMKQLNVATHQIYSGWQGGLKTLTFGSATPIINVTDLSGKTVEEGIDALMARLDR